MKSFVKNSLALFMLIVLSVPSCKKENMCDCFKSTGKEETIERTLAEFSKINVEDKLDVHLLEGSSYSVKIVGGKNVIKLVKTEIADGKLTLKNDNRCNFVRSYNKKINVYVTAPKYAEIMHNGVGTIYCPDPLVASDSIIYRIHNSGDLHMNVNNTWLTGDINGMGDLYAKGKTYKHLSNVNGEAWLNCKDLDAQITDLYLKTSGLSYVNAQTHLFVTIQRDGNVYYKGDPSTVIRWGNGPGQLIKGY